MIVPDSDESLLRNPSLGPIVSILVELFSPPWPLEGDWEWGDFKLLYGMSESGTILLDCVDFCLDPPDEFCPVFAGLIMSG